MTDQEKIKSLTEQVAALTVALDQQSKDVREASERLRAAWPSNKALFDRAMSILHIACTPIKDASPILAQHDREVEARGLRKAGNWFNAWTGYPVSCASVGGALYRMADDVLRSQGKEGGR